jgi:hypothetical protein
MTGLSSIPMSTRPDPKATLRAAATRLQGAEAELATALAELQPSDRADKQMVSIRRPALLSTRDRLQPSAGQPRVDRQCQRRNDDSGQ